MNSTLYLVIPQPTGVCSGVKNTLEFLPRLRAAHPEARIFANHQPVHHREADRELKRNSIAMLDPNNPDILREGDLVVGSAHGTPLEEIEQVRNSSAVFVDTVCPLVGANFNWISAPGENNVVYIGKPGDREYEATVSRARGSNCFLVDLHQGDVDAVASAIRQSEIRSIVLLRQTTIPGNDPDIIRIHGMLRNALPDAEFKYRSNLGLGECYATQNRQESLARGIEQYHPQAVLVLTAPNSSNGMALAGSAQSYGVPVLYAEYPAPLMGLVEQGNLFESAQTLLLVAAASVVQKVIDSAVEQICARVESLGRNCEVQLPWLINKEREPELKPPRLP